MDFDFLDEVIELSPERIVAVKHVTPEEECFRDHFPTFPILPGVLMLETMVQAGRRLVAEAGAEAGNYALGEVKAVKYGAMVKPGMVLRVEVSLAGEPEDGAYRLKGKGVALSPGETEGPTAVGGKFTLRPVRVLAAGAELTEI